MKRNVWAGWLLACLITSQCTTPAPIRQTEVLVIGGGVSGTAAAIQAARLGAEVLWITENEWLGGMLTAAGVSATDGNHRLPSGLWGEFRDSLYAHYGGAEAVATGWVSNTQFEPQVGNRIWHNIAAAESTLTRWSGYRLTAVHKKGKQVIGASFVNEEGVTKRIDAQITIEATELGDVLALSKTPFLTGQDTPEDPHNNEIQDLTYAAILKDYGVGSDHTIAHPPAYDPAEFACVCAEVCEEANLSPPDCQTMLNYGRLPNGKYMINWPNNGNDYFVNPIPLNEAQRDSVYQVAKERTLAFVHYLQTEAGYPHYGLAEDEFRTPDHLPLIPYHRESRRVRGLVQLTVEDLLDPYSNSERKLYQSAIAVGDYPLDHHHDKNPNAAPEDFPPIPSFSVPYGVLVPQEMDGLLVAEKSISVTHMVNGATRLQPCVILIGQAAGAAAALCVQTQTQARDLNLNTLQQTLLESGCWLLPFIDVGPDDPDFMAIQRVGVMGLLRGTGVPYKWANQTWFYPDSAIAQSDFWAAFPVEITDNILLMHTVPGLTQGQGMELIWGQLTRSAYQAKGDNALNGFRAEGWITEDFDPSRPLTRRQMARWVDRIWTPFEDMAHWVAP